MNSEKISTEKETSHDTLAGVSGSFRVMKTMFFSTIDTVEADNLSEERANFLRDEFIKQEEDFHVDYYVENYH